MRISAHHQNLYPVDMVHRFSALRVDPPAPLPDRYPEQKPSARPLAERVVEGEVLPRPMAAQSLMADYRTSMLTRATNSTATPASDAPQTAAPSQLLFYLLHSSSETLTDSNVGRHIDQRI